MEIYHGTEGLKLLNTCVTIGKFDGLHAGHQQLLKKLLEYKEKGFTTVVLTFDADTDEVLKKENGAGCTQLTPTGQKAEMLEKLGIDIMVVYPFNKATAQMKAEDFLHDVLSKKLGMRVLVAGDDFRFGAGREGDIAFLRKKEAKYGFVTEVVSRYAIDDTVVSSTQIRRLLGAGDCERAERLLNRDFFKL